MKIIKSLYNYYSHQIKGSTVSKAGQTIKSNSPAKVPQDLFCNTYWKLAQEKYLIKTTNKTSVSTHGQLNGINHHFIHSPYPKDMDRKAVNSDLTVREMIRKTDYDFKTLKPTTKKLYVYRCIGEKPDFFPEFKQYQKALNTQKGDIITMREYAYATSDKNYASVYMGNNRGIRYEIEIPEGSRVSRIGQIGSSDEIVFPRSSKFECIGTQKVKDSDNDYIIIKLKYLKPEETWRI